MDECVYKCLRCELVFGAEEECKICPDCNSDNITTDISDEEFDSYLKIMNEGEINEIC